jgi:hypothetical protein
MRIRTKHRRPSLRVAIRPAQPSTAAPIEELPEEPHCGQDYTRVSRMLGNEHYRVPAPFDVYVRADSLAALRRQWAHWRPQHAPHCGAIVGIPLRVMAFA